MSRAEEALLLAAAWSRPDPRRLPELAWEFERLFVGPGPVPCPPYESFWREDAPILLRSAFMGPSTIGLVNLYHRLGLRMPDRATELPDHVAVEFEALAVAAEAGREDIAADLVEEHLGRWLRQFCDAVAEETFLDYYRDLAADTEDWLAMNLPDDAGPGAREG